MDLGPQQIGKWLLVAGICVAAMGGVMILLGKAGLFRLPGDMEFGGRNWRVYFPVGTCILLSIILTLVLWLISYLRR